MTYPKMTYPKSRSPTFFSKKWPTPKVNHLPFFPKNDLPQKSITYLFFQKMTYPKNEWPTPKCEFWKIVIFLVRVKYIQDKCLFYLLNDLFRCVVKNEVSVKKLNFFLSLGNYEVNHFVEKVISKTFTKFTFTKIDLLTFYIRAQFDDQIMRNKYSVSV